MPHSLTHEALASALTVEAVGFGADSGLVNTELNLSVMLHDCADIPEEYATGLAEAP